MGTPKGLKCLARVLVGGGRVHVYYDASRIVLQLRREVPTEEDLLGTSVKVAVVLSATEALMLATDLLNVAVPRLAAPLEQVEVNVSEE